MLRICRMNVEADNQDTLILVVVRKGKWMTGQWDGLQDSSFMWPIILQVSTILSQFTITKDRKESVRMSPSLPAGLPWQRRAEGRGQEAESRERLTTHISEPRPDAGGKIDISTVECECKWLWAWGLESPSAGSPWYCGLWLVTCDLWLVICDLWFVRLWDCEIVASPSEARRHGASIGRDQNTFPVSRHVPA